MNSFYTFGKTVDLTAKFVDAANAGITNANGQIYIFRISDSQYWNGATWQAARIANGMTEIDETNQAGWWKYSFDTNNGLSADKYIIEIEDNSGNAVNTIQEGSLEVGNWPDDIETKIDTIDTVVDAVKAKTDNLPADPTSEANATTNKNTIVTEIDANETKIDAIQAKTDNLPADPASEANATTNTNSIITEVDANETKIDAIQAKTDNLPADPTSETQATANMNTIIAEIDANELALDDAEAAAVGRAKYDPVTSILTLYEKDNPNTIHKQFNCKDKDGNPALDNAIYEKVPI